MFCCRKEITRVSVAFFCVALTVACGGKHRDAILPTGSAHDAPSVTASPVSADDAVRQSYTGYWAALPRAEHADDATLRRQLLTDYAMDPQLTNALQGIDDLHNKGLTSSGYVVVHIQKVQLGGDAATVWDCQDTTKAVIQKSGTGEIVSHGDPKDLIRATLSRGSDGRWRISKFASLSRC